MASTADILEQLRAKANPGNLDGMARFGMAVDKRLGVSVPAMRQIAKRADKNHDVAIELSGGFQMRRAMRLSNAWYVA